VTIVAPFAPGGTSDYVGRLIGEKLAARTHQPFVVVNKAGGTGAVANGYVRAQPPDGYTLYLVTSPFSTAPATQPSVHNYDPAKDFTPIAQVANIVAVLYASKKAPAGTLADVIAYAKANPGKVTAGTTGIGSSDHLAAAKFAGMAGVELTYVPYKGAALALQDMLAGNIDIRFDSYITPKPHIESGQVRALGMATLKRSTLAPNIPAVSETVKDYEVPSYVGLVGPAGMPAELLARIHAELGAVMKMPEVIEKLSGQGLEPTLTSPQDFSVYLSNHVRAQAQLIKDLKIKIE
jgi:tripartite-type tricarboxylate transporter receptor subunit TctC